MTKHQKRRTRWLSIVALLLTIAVALHTRLGACLPPPPEAALVIAAKCDAHTVVAAIIASIGEAIARY